MKRVISDKGFLLQCATKLFKDDEKYREFVKEEKKRLRNYLRYGTLIYDTQRYGTFKGSIRDTFKLKEKQN